MAPDGGPRIYQPVTHARPARVELVGGFAHRRRFQLYRVGRTWKQPHQSYRQRHRDAVLYAGYSSISVSIEVMVGRSRTAALLLSTSSALLLLLEALNNKRLHDLGQSGLFGFLFYAPAAITAVTFFTDWRPAFDDALWCTRLAAWWFGAAGLWFVVRLGFYLGNRGDNKFGPARR